METMTMLLWLLLIHCVLPLLSNVQGSWIDPMTPTDNRKISALTQRHSIISASSSAGESNENQVDQDDEEEELELVFSDEFNVDHRPFADGTDPKWTAIEKDDYTNYALQYYDSSLVTTRGGYLNISTIVKDTTFTTQDVDTITGKKTSKTVTKNYRSGMVQGWNKFCFTGGVVEVSARLPGHALTGGLWPAVWLMGNLVRATYVGSSNNVWPWSYDTCDKDVQAQQKFSQCNVVNHYGFQSHKGRGAPEIDIFEVMPGREDLSHIAEGVNTAKPYMSTSLQVAPGLQEYRPTTGSLPDYSQPWYRHDISYGENTSLNIFFYGMHLVIGGAETATAAATVSAVPASTSSASTSSSSLTGTSSSSSSQDHSLRASSSRSRSSSSSILDQDDDAPISRRRDKAEVSTTSSSYIAPSSSSSSSVSRSKSYFTDAISANRNLATSHFEEQHIYRLEWETGPNGYLAWYLDDEFVYSIRAAAMSDITGAIIPEEPMYLILNTAVSSTWGFPTPCPEGCACDCFDCRLAECTCGIPAGMCENLPASMLIDYVRVYQSKEHSLGCDTEEHPSATYIAAQADKFKTDNDKVPLLEVVSGGGQCDYDEDCNSFTSVQFQTENTEVKTEKYESRIGAAEEKTLEEVVFGGYCKGGMDYFVSSLSSSSSSSSSSSKKKNKGSGTCVCNKGYTGPHCLAFEGSNPPGTSVSTSSSDADSSTDKLLTPRDVLLPPSLIFLAVGIGCVLVFAAVCKGRQDRLLRQQAAAINSSSSSSRGANKNSSYIGYQPLVPQQQQQHQYSVEMNSAIGHSTVKSYQQQ